MQLLDAVTGRHVRRSADCAGGHLHLRRTRVVGQQDHWRANCRTRWNTQIQTQGTEADFAAAVTRFQRSHEDVGLTSSRVNGIFVTVRLMAEGALSPQRETISAQTIRDATETGPISQMNVRLSYQTRTVSYSTTCMGDCLSVEGKPSGYITKYDQPSTSTQPFVPPG